MRRGTGVVGVLALLSVGVAAGAASGDVEAVATGGLVGFGGTSAAARTLGAVLWVVLLGVLVAAGAWLAFDRLRAAGGDGRVPGRGRLVVLAVAVVLFVFGVLLVAVRAFEDGSGPRRQEGVGGPLLQGSPEGVAATGGPGPTVVLGVLAVLVLAGVVVLAARAIRSRDGHAREPTDESTNVEDGRPDAGAVRGDQVGAAAGRAAAHLSGSGAPLDNDVVRAWRELADVLPVPRPASATPREFAAAAVDAGVDRTAVEELTALFEAVRYGHREPTGEQTERAVAALERIESDAIDRRGRPSETAADPGRSTPPGRDEVSEP